MIKIDYGPYKISPVRQWSDEPKVRILISGSAGRPLTSLRDEDGREMRFENKAVATQYLIDNKMISLGEPDRLRNDGAGKYAASKKGRST